MSNIWLDPFGLRLIKRDNGTSPSKKKGKKDKNDAKSPTDPPPPLAQYQYYQSNAFYSQRIFPYSPSYGFCQQPMEVVPRMPCECGCKTNKGEKIAKKEVKKVLVVIPSFSNPRQMRKGVFER